MNDEIFLARTAALHDILTAWISGIQEASPADLARFMQRDPALLADCLIQHLTHSDGRVVTTTLTR